MFELATVGERKALLGQCISQIVVDRDREVVNLAIRRLPGIAGERDMLASERAENKLPTTGEEAPDDDFWTLFSPTDFNLLPESHHFPDKDLPPSR